MKKVLIIAMVGIMLTGVGCKQTDKVAEDVKKNSKQPHIFPLFDLIFFLRIKKL